MDAEQGGASATSVQKIISFQSKALDGLRGFAALHIVLFHSTHYANLQWNIHGQVSKFLFQIALFRALNIEK